MGFSVELPPLLSPLEGASVLAGIKSLPVHADVLKMTYVKVTGSSHKHVNPWSLYTLCRNTTVYQAAIVYVVMCFPKDLEICLKWRIAIKRKDPLKKGALSVGLFYTPKDELALICTANILGKLHNVSFLTKNHVYLLEINSLQYTYMINLSCAKLRFEFVSVFVLYQTRW
jgi:hypothetical protein